MVNLLIKITLFFIVLLSCSCRSSQTTERVTTKIDTIYKYVAALNDNYTAHVDTLHDSIYVREVVNEQGETKYKERIVYRDRVGKTLVKTNTIHATIQVVKHDLSQNITEKKVLKPSLYKIIIVIAVFLLLLIIISYVVKHFKT